MKSTLIRSDEEEAEFCEFLNRQIKNFNNLISPHHRAARRPEAITPLNIILKSEAGEIVGGLSAETYWGWLSIDDFYLPAELRGQGVGAHILEMAESAAIKRGCIKSVLSTYSFQAPNFYLKQGYKVVGTLEDYPPGSAFYWLQKDLG